MSTAAAMWMAQRQGKLAEVQAELQQERANALGRVGEALEARIHDLHQLAITLQHLLPGSERTQALRKYARVRDTALELKWFLVVQREAIGLTDHSALEQHYVVPRAITE
ncbi:MAG: hypothetical protein IT370_10960 [Deltaproteobacteria bacterium]|nr:hypothetical protein [Deltaproteobacteria bacterium]